MKIDKENKPKIIKIAQNIMKNAPDIPMYKAIILAATTFTLGISTGACMNNIMHSKQERKTSISEELDSNSDIIEAGSILNVKFSDDSNMIIVEDNQELGNINNNSVNLYDKFQTTGIVNIRLYPDASDDDLIMHTIGPDEELYINVRDTALYNLSDNYNWKPAIYEKDGIEYDGFVAFFDEKLSKILDAKTIKAKVAEDVKVDFKSEKDQKLFNSIEKNVIIRGDKEYIVASPNNNIEYNESEIYSLIEDETPDRPVIHGYKDVKITDKDIKLISKYIASWENAPLYHYLTGYSNDYNNLYVSSCITEDRKNYICYIDGLGFYGDNSARNYGFGVNVSSVNSLGYREKNIAHVDILEKKYGYDLNDQSLLQPGVSLMPVEVIDEAKEYYLKERVEEVKETLKNYDIQFTKGEILALAAISYQCGSERIPNLIENYAKWGNSKELRRNFVLAGYNPFEYAPGDTVEYKGFTVGRAYSYWAAFHDNKLIFTDGSVKTFDKNTREVDNEFDR